MRNGKPYAPTRLEDLKWLMGVTEAIAQPGHCQRGDTLYQVRRCRFIFSEVVLEHVPRGDFTAVMAELYCILKRGGSASHAVNFRDHLDGGWNNLRFSQRLWEAPWFARRSGFYTNRLRLSEIVALATRAGFSVTVLQRET